MADNVNHPKHYTSHPSGVEAIEITRWLRGPYSNACKYVMRGWEGLKGDPIEDLRKAIWYLNDAEKFPDDGKGIPNHAHERLALWNKHESDENKKSVVNAIVVGNTWERFNGRCNGFVEFSKSLINSRITYLQSRPGVAL